MRQVGDATVFILPFPLLLRSTFQLPLSHTSLPPAKLECKNRSEPLKSVYYLSLLLILWVDPSDPVRPDRHVPPSFRHMSAGVELEL
jgi:hypothetical protein